MTKIIDREEAERLGGVYKGELIRDYNMACNVPDMDKFIESIVTGNIEYLIKTKYNNVLMCALPKSGSQYTWQLLSRSLGYDRIEISFSVSSGTFYYPRMLAAKYTEKNTISHCHAHLNANIRNIVYGLDLKVLVHTRNILDALVSRRDRLIQYFPPYSPPIAIEKFLSSGDEHQLDTVIEMFANKYISFVTGWSLYNTSVMWTTYEEMVADEAGLVERVADWLGFEVIGDVERISKDIKEAGGINFNKGVIGRGKKLFNDRQKEDIRRRADILGCDDEQFLGGT